MRTLGILLLFLLQCLVACERAGDHRTSTGPVAGVSADDEEMNAAMQEARDSFPASWRAGEESSARAAGGPVMVKAYFSSSMDADGGEHMWVDEVSFDGKMISGVLASEPLELDEPRLGDAVEFPLERLSDWLIVEHGVAQGAFTIQVLRKRMTDEERADHDSRYPFSFRAID